MTIYFLCTTPFIVIISLFRDASSKDEKLLYASTSDCNSEKEAVRRLELMSLLSIGYGDAEQFIASHLRTCRDEDCPLHTQNYVMNLRGLDTQSSLELDSISLIQVILFEHLESFKYFGLTPSLVLSYCHFVIDSKNVNIADQKKRLLYMIKTQIENPELSRRNLHSFFKLRWLIEDQKGLDLVFQGKEKKNLVDMAEMEYRNKLTKKFEFYLEKCLQRITEFWSLLSENSPQAKKLEESLENLAGAADLFLVLWQKNKTQAEKDPEIMQYYFMFLEFVKIDLKKAGEYKIKAANLRRLILELKFKFENIKLECDFTQSSKALAVIHTTKNLSLVVKKLNTEFARCFGYTKREMREICFDRFIPAQLFHYYARHLFCEEEDGNFKEFFDILLLDRFERLRLFACRVRMIGKESDSYFLIELSRQSHAESSIKLLFDRELNFLESSFPLGKDYNIPLNLNEIVNFTLFFRSEVKS